MPRQGAVLAEGERPREERRRGQRVLELKEVLGLGHRCLELAVVHFLVVLGVPVGRMELPVAYILMRIVRIV